jgi:putative oxidoreductase
MNKETLPSEVEMTAKANRFLDEGLLILRIGLGVMFLYHGGPKIIGGTEMWARIGIAAGNFGVTFWPTFWGLMSGIAEFGGGLCLILGLLFRPAMILLIINLAVAASTHFAGGQGLAGASHAIEDAIMFVGLFFIGPGRYSLHALLASKQAGRIAGRNTPVS